MQLEETAKYIQIDVLGKIAILSNPKQCIVCDNTDYAVTFRFSEEWDGYTNKTCRFKYGRKYTDVVFSGDTVEVPRLSDCEVCEIGIFAGDLYTTTPAKIFCHKSILSGGGSPAEPTDDVYNQIMDMLADIKAGEVSQEDIEKAVNSYMQDNPVEIQTDETLSYKDGKLAVNTANEPDPDNTLPITSAAVATTVGNIEILLKTI